MYVIRHECPDDWAAIAALTTAAFAGHPHSDQQEAAIIARLRQRGELSLSLVATEGDGLVGHIAFSPVTLDDGTAGWQGLGPMAVLPALQRRGIGSALVQSGLGYLRQSNARGCVVLGDPAFYQRFGFCPCPQLVLANMPPDYFMALAFDRHAAPASVTPVRYSPAFYDL